MMKRFFLLLISIAVINVTTASKAIDSVGLAYFMEGMIQSKLSDNNIAGAAACIVQDGKILLLEGYGYSDLEKRTPVKPEETLFRIGSVSKLFTWIAVMQMVEQGKLDLDTDINEYLVDFKIPDTYDEPITMTHLMTHTPGFEDILTGLFAENLMNLSLSELLQRQMPKRVRPPGVHASYSNHGTGIAAHIVEILSGMEWIDYVEKYIIEPLDMHHTTFRQPLPERLNDLMSKGYLFENGEMTEKPFEFVPLSAAGGTSTTAKDMANFMLMLMQQGQFNNDTILDSDTYNLMMKPVMYHAPMVNPLRYGFMDVSRKCQTIIGHGGDTFWFHSLMVLIPEHNLGFFISFNSDGGAGAYEDTFKIFLDKYFHKEKELTPQIDVDEKYLKRFSGKYKPNRTPRTDYMKALSLAMQGSISVKNGMLRTDFMGDVSYWVPIDSLIFREQHSCEILAFEENDRGRIAHVFLGSLPIIAIDKVPFWESQVLNLAIIVVAIILCVITLFFWPLVFFIRRNYKPLRKKTKQLPIGTKITAWFAALLLLLFYFLIIAVVGSAESVVFSAPPPTGLIPVLVIPFLVIALTLIMIFNTFKIFPVKAIPLRSRLYYLILMAVNMIAVAQLYYWNLIGFHYH